MRLMMKLIIPFCGLCAWMLSCTTVRLPSEKKYGPDQLRADYDFMQRVLEQKHASLYWYTPEDSMRYYFSLYRNRIQDSMTERAFTWQVLNPMLDKIHCGHTTISLSKQLAKTLGTVRTGSFPFYVKVWSDTMAVIGVQQADSLITYGTIIHAIDDIPVQEIVNHCFEYLPEDGYANNVNYIRLSANFPYYYEQIFGSKDSFKITYSNGYTQHRTHIVPAFKPKKDTLLKQKAKTTTQKKTAQPDPKLKYRSVYFDSSGLYAYMTLNSFSNGKPGPFFRKTFRKLRREKTPTLVIDLRYNRGGKVRLSTLLTRYLTAEKFKVADTVYAKTRTLKPFTKNFSNKWLNNFQLFFTTRKLKDGKYHLRYFEQKIYTPKKKNRYKGQVYLITSGPTFSAATLVTNTLKGQKNIMVVGEETGGGWHGNSGIMLPMVTFPNTRIRLTVPLFRVVQYKHVPKTGTGIIPDWYIGPSYETIMNRKDAKKEAVIQYIIRSAKKS